MWCFEEGSSWWPFFGGLWTLLFGGGLITLVVWGIGRLTRQSCPSSGHNALDMAKERYARGEITKEEYNQYKKDLS